MCEGNLLIHEKQSSGKIVNLGSVAGESGIGSSLPYATAKPAIHTMTYSLVSYSHLTFELTVFPRERSPRVDRLGMMNG
ncbi:SDR family NAD(P)-dependent oxidoreductase [Exiguobacterium undae]|uniref:SDR family NAD(P)-dependent oxidoreductase n=1 Tax=Exiguobacterium undae TaxID=169177 RepID=UPI002E14FCF3